MKRVRIVEVGPRDGLQNEKTLFEIDQKLEMIRRLEAAGARRMEVVSFVNPRRVPQMAGAEEIMAALPPAEGRSRIGLVLNMKGWERCVAAGCDEANVVVCATDGFGIRNQGASVDEQVKTLGDIMAVRRKEEPPVTMTVSVAFGCPFDGEVPEDRVIEIVKAAADMRVAEIALADTIGVADPWTVRRRIEAARKAAGHIPLRLHFHDTRNTGLANAYAGVEAGVTVLDASVGGLGGCPFAPGATGNIATEELVHMLEDMGISTGIDLAKLIAAAQLAEGLLGRTLPSGVLRAGPRTRLV